MIFIDRKMQFVPGALCRNIVLFLAAFVFAIALESGELRNDPDIQGNVMLRLELLLKPGRFMSAFMARASKFMKPSIWRDSR